MTDVVSKEKNGKAYHSVLLRESVRIGKKVCSRTIANLSSLSSAAIAGIKNALQGKSEASLEGLVKTGRKSLLQRIRICKYFSPRTEVSFTSFGMVWNRLSDR